MSTKRTWTRFAAALVLSMTALGCGNETAPLTSSRSARHPLIGVYDVTTVLDSLGIEQSGPQCPDYYPAGTVYCVVVRPSSGGLLQGTLVIGDSVIVVDTIYPGVGLPPRPIRDTIIDRLPLVTGSFVGRSCTLLDYQRLTGCLQFADSARADYVLAGAPITTGSFPETRRSFTVSLRSTSSDPQRTLTLWTVRDAGDTIWGRLTWRTEAVSRNPPMFYGAFRAVQRR